MHDFELGTAQKLDRVLNTLLQFGKGGISFDSLLSKVKPEIIDGDELIKLLSQLEKDSYITRFTRSAYENVGAGGSFARQVERDYFSITLPGQQFHKNGGYTQVTSWSNDLDTIHLKGSQKDEIINNALTEVKRAGSARVGYHAEKILGMKPVPHNIISKLEGTITRSPKYVSEPHPNFKGDYTIKLKARTFIEKYAFPYAVGMIILSALVSIASTLITEKINNKEHSQSTTQQEIRLSNIADSLFNLEKRLKDSGIIHK